MNLNSNSIKKSSKSGATEACFAKNEEAAILIEGLNYRYQSAKENALTDINISIKNGKITGFAGPDGAGKSTLMRIMAGLLKPTAGSLRVAGIDPIKQTKDLHWRLGYMPQKFGLYEDLTVIENLTLYADLRNVIGENRVQQFEHLLTFTDLKQFTKRMAGQLSGGMKQKLGLACTLLGNPQILLLDEPGVGVDPISRRELWKMVNDITKNGIAVVWATAYMDEAELCDEVCLMNAGKIVYTGSPAQAIDQMREHSIAIKGINKNRRTVLLQSLLLSNVIDGTIQGSSVRLVLKDSQIGPDLKQIGAKDQATIEKVKPRLEDMFINLLGGIRHRQSVLAEHMPKVELDDSIDSNAIIAVNNLTRRFGDFIATDHVSFNVRKGEIFGLIGPNGAGKSTTFKMLCGLLPISEGDAFVLGVNLKHSAPKARQQLGYMAQKFSLYANLTVKQNLKFFSGVYGLRTQQRQDRIDEMVECFSLENYLNTNTNDLPLGFKQRLALACSLMHRPKLLFLDEPTSGVDPLTRREFWGHINGLVDKGVTVLVTTHFMDEAEYCDRIALIYRGKAIAIGPTDELKQQIISTEHPDPTMEDTFVELIMRNEKMHQQQSSQGAS